MKIKTALEKIGQLGAAEKRRLLSYQAELAKEKDRKIFDDRMRDYLVHVSNDGGKLVLEVNDYLDSIGWNQSKYDPKQIDEQVGRFAEIHKPNRSWRRKFSHVKETNIKEVEEWKLKELRYDSKEAIIEALPRLDTHAGFSYILTGKKQKGDYTGELLETYLREEAEARLNNSFNKPILIGSRTQGTVPFDPVDKRMDLGDKTPDKLKKTRLVSMIDIYVVLAECKWAKPFQWRLGKEDWYMGGKDDSAVHYIVSKYRKTYTRWTSLDYSKYDQSIPAWLIREAFDIVRAAFVQDEFDEELFTIVREDFIHKVFITAGEPVEAHDGVPSGSMFTQIIDSIVNKLMIDTYMCCQGITDYKMCIMGDDNLIFTKRLLSGKDIENYLKKEFGIEMNAQKMDTGDCRKNHPLFLSRYWTWMGPYRHPQVLIAKLLFPERRREYDKYGFTPSMVLESYFSSFMLGMEEFIIKGIHDRIVKGERKKVSASKWLTGLAAYKLNYVAKYNEFTA